MNAPGTEIARALTDLGLASAAIIRALVEELGLTPNEAEDALRAANDRVSPVP